MRARLNPTVLVPACRSSKLTQKVITNLENVRMEKCTSYLEKEADEIDENVTI